MNYKKRIEELQQKADGAQGLLDLRIAEWQRWVQMMKDQHMNWGSSAATNQSMRTVHLAMRIASFKHEIFLLERLEQIDDMIHELKKHGVTPDEKKEIQILHDEQASIKKELERLSAYNDSPIAD